MAAAKSIKRFLPIIEKSFDNPWVGASPLNKRHKRFGFVALPENIAKTKSGGECSNS
jgi:hypothetical protein